MVRKSLLLILIPSLLAADDVSESRHLQQEARQAYRAKDYAQFLTKIGAASDLRPSHPTLLYNFAAGLALNGRGDESLAVLERVAQMGMVYAPEKDADFDSLRTSPRFDLIVAALQHNASTSGSAKPAFVLPERGLIAEGVAWDDRSKRFFISSVRNGSILAIDRRGRFSTFVRDLPRGVFGMAFDAKRGVLWATTSALPQNIAFREEDRDRAAVVKIDSRTGRILETLAPSDTGKHLFGDLVVGTDGVVYLSDTTRPAIHLIRDRAIEPFLTGAPFISLQGLTLAPDGKTLYAADYSKGIAAIDLSTRDVHFLPVPREVTLLGVDGLYFAGRSDLIATQNGTNPQRVIRIRLAPGGLSVERVDTLSANQTDDITLGVIANGSFYFNGNAGWSEYDEAGKVKDESKLKQSVLYRLPLSH